MTKRIVLILTALFLALGLFGCGGEPAPETLPPTTEAPTQPAPTAQELYQEARAALDAAENLKLDITTSTVLSVGEETFLVDSLQALKIAGDQVNLSETLTIGDTEETYEEVFSDGTLYSTIAEEYHYQNKISREEYLASFAPAVLLDASLYGSVTMDDTGKVRFAQPTGAESWALPEGAVFETASGSAQITDGAVTESSYTLTYRHGGSQVTQTVTVKPEIPASLTLAAPAADRTYQENVEIDAVKAYDMALAFLFESNAVESRSSENIVSQAAAMVYGVQKEIAFHGADSKLSADVTQTVSITQSGQADSYTLNEHFEDSRYTYSENGGDPAAGQLLTADMLEYAQGLLAENVYALDYIEATETQVLGGMTYTSVTFSQEYAQFLTQYISATLFDDEAFLEEVSEGLSHTQCTGYFAIDPCTGFPTSLSITYAGTHSVDGSEYALALEATQSFYPASLSAYRNITGSMPEEAAPQTPATPLFYHVTGGEGQEMWLMGTIHVGDSRTAYLPQEIYDALENSDALAVEFDLQAFEAALETDAQLIAQLAPLYFYTDGTATVNHLEEEVYQDGRTMLQITGDYAATAEAMKPYLWSQTIENFFLRQGYSLVSEKGMDQRLLTLAKEQGKPILDIESGLQQMEMMANYSSELQQMLLEESLDTSAWEYITGVEDLYEKWCAGDEAVLREELGSAQLEDTEDLTQEEIAKYQALLDEYNKAMSTDRNAGMLDAAMGYLEGDQVVFCAVGLAHLLDGTNGLVDALREAGYTVELVAYK